MQMATLNKDRMEIKNFHTLRAQVRIFSVSFFLQYFNIFLCYPFFTAVIIDENRMANHDVTKSGDRDRNQAVPINE